LSEVQSTTVEASARRSSRRRKPKPSCADCYFGRRELCALELGEPCSTFRPDSPEGLMPPTQPMLLVDPDSAQGVPAVRLAA
jgi:hypothetical protein